MNMKMCWLLIFLLLAPLSLNAQEIDWAIWKDYSPAFVVYDRHTKNRFSIDPTRASERLAPCSTFKIYNTLIGLELELIKDVDAPWYQWDGVKRDIEGWNKDLSLREAFRVSSVPAYQMLARHIGLDRMKTYIEKIGYGSRDVSSGVDIFWLPRADRVSIKISADEQVDLLNKLLDGGLPFSKKNVMILRDVMLVEKTDKGMIYGKTGSGMGSDGKWDLGWFVGFLEHGDSIYVFACNIIGGKTPSGIVARQIVIDYFKKQGVL